MRRFVNPTGFATAANPFLRGRPQLKLASNMQSCAIAAGGRDVRAPSITENPAGFCDQDDADANIALVSINLIHLRVARPFGRIRAEGLSWMTSNQL